MIQWKKQGPAVVGSIVFLDGRKGNVVIVGGRDNAKGATIIAPNRESGEAETIPMAKGAALLPAEGMIDILAMQERLHGDNDLKPPAHLE